MEDYPNLSVILNNNKTIQQVNIYSSMPVSKSHLCSYILNTQTKEIVKVQSTIRKLFHGVGATTTVEVVLQSMEQTLLYLLLSFWYSL